MKSARLQNATHRFRKPDDWDEEKHGPCMELDVIQHDGVCVSAWIPSPEELALLNAGHPVYVHLVGGQPAMGVTVGEEKPGCAHTQLMVGQREGDGAVVGTCQECGHIEVLGPASQLDSSSYATN